VDRRVAWGGAAAGAAFGAVGPNGRRRSGQRVNTTLTNAQSWSWDFWTSVMRLL
jgi:hypothetical protein